MEFEQLLKIQWREYKSVIPGLKLKFKDEHRAWRATPKSLQVNATSIGRTIWLPSRDWYSNDLWAFSVIAHEFQHSIDWIRFGVIGFAMRYFFPQILAIIPLIATIVTLCFGMWGIALALFGCVCVLVAPWSSKTRTDIERRGYSMNIAVRFVTKGVVTKAHCHHIRRSMKSPTYYWMFHGDTDELIEEMVKNIKGPRWPRDLQAFAPTVGALLEAGFVCETARNALRWLKH